MIGKKLYKEKFTNKEYADTAVWCNENNAHIEDKGEYFEVIRDEQLSVKETVFYLEKQIEKINIDMLRDMLIVNDDEQTEEKKQEAKQYLAQKKTEKNKLIEKINKLREV